MLTNFRRTFARVYGPAAITWWSWLLTLPFALTVMSGLQYVDGGPAAVLAVSALQHAILGGVLLVGVAVLRLVRGRGRPFAVFAIFAATGAARPLLFLEAGGLLHIPVEAGDLFGRIAINVVVMVVILGLIAVGVGLVREHRGVFRRLRAAQRASERDVECAAERLRSLRSSAVDEVVAALEHAAEVAVANRMRPAEAARLLRTVAEDVVRPASHRVYADADAEDRREPESLGPREWSVSVIGGMSATPPVATAVLFSLLVVPFALQLFGPMGLVAVAAGLLLLIVVNTTVARIELPGRAPARLAALCGLYVVTGTLLTLTSGVVLDLLGVAPTSIWFEALMYPIIAVAVAFVDSLSVRLRLDQAELEDAVQASVATAARLRAEVEHERASLARLLHSGVQSELIAGALALTASPAGHTVDAADTGARIARVVERARDALRGAAPEPGPAEQVRALLDSWSSAIGLTAHIGDGVWERLGDPSRISALVDAISEGLANAVRHGDGSPVRLEVRSDEPEGVEVRIVSGGSIAAGHPGIGLRQLSEHGTVALRESAGRVELAVAIP